VATWVVILSKVLALRRTRAMATQVEPFWHSCDMNVGLHLLGKAASNPFYHLASASMHALSHHREFANAKARQLHDGLDLSDWVTRSLRNSIDDASARMQSGLALLASVGSTAPFVGLFGTVWGIYHALMTISAAGQASIDKVAGPIGEALIMTALGLAVAIPAVLGYNALLRANKSVQGLLNRFAHDLHAYCITGSRMLKFDAGRAQVVPLQSA
jgi:biopolymer transport protein ExbB